MVATELNDRRGVVAKRIKFEDYMEKLPDVDKHFLGRCFNAVDSEIYRSQGAEEQQSARRTYQTFLKALRKLARRVCLEPGEKLSPTQIAEITRTREFLGPDFFDIMGFYGVDIVHSAGLWTFTESQSAEKVAKDLKICIKCQCDELCK